MTGTWNCQTYMYNYATYMVIVFMISQVIWLFCNEQPTLLSAALVRGLHMYVMALYFMPHTILGTQYT